MTILTIKASMIMSMYMNAQQNSESTYCYNADVENNHVVAQYVYDQSTVANWSSDCIVLKPKVKHDYVYDSEDRLITRTTSRWDGAEWQPCDQMEYEYTATGYCVTLSHWDIFQHRFKMPEAKTVAPMIRVGSLLPAAMRRLMTRVGIKVTPEVLRASSVIMAGVASSLP